MVSNAGSESFYLTWEPPLNLNTTPGVTYNIVIGDEIYTELVRNLTDATFFYVSSINPCTTYSVEVTALYSGETGPVNDITVTTLALLPPPENITFSLTNGHVSVMWQRPSLFYCGIEMYRLSLRCNQFVHESEIGVWSNSIVVDFCEESLGIGWCVAQMQSCDSIRCGNFSDEATASSVQSPPSRPNCLLQTQSATNISISFTLLDPFITDDVRIEWNLTSINFSRTEASDYSKNVLDFEVRSNSDYDFQLKVCNIYGCGDPCALPFRTSVSCNYIGHHLYCELVFPVLTCQSTVYNYLQESPIPPRNIEVSSISNISAHLTWGSVLDQNYSYSISLTSSCASGNDMMNGINGTSYTLRNLCPYTNYTVAVRATDLQVNKSSLYSEILDFSTLDGIPSHPRYVFSVLGESGKSIRVTWIIPTDLNGMIDSYDITWTINKQQCDGKDIPGMKANASSFEYYITITNVAEPIEGYSVCVRAITSTGRMGQWGMHVYNPTNTERLITPPEDCDTLTAVACVAAFTVASSLIMSVILSISIIQKGWFCSKNEVHGEKTR
jgi:hypothetical protein